VRAHLSFETSFIRSVVPCLSRSCEIARKEAQAHADAAKKAGEKSITGLSSISLYTFFVWSSLASSYDFFICAYVVSNDAFVASAIFDVNAAALAAITWPLTQRYSCV
jgi:hypothetical protein